MRQCLLVLALGVVAIVAVSSMRGEQHAAYAAAAAPASCTANAHLSDYDRQQAAAAINGKQPVTMELLAHTACVSFVLDELRVLSPTLGFIDRKSGYIELNVTPSQVQDVLAIQGLDAARTVSPLQYAAYYPKYIPRSQRIFGISSFRVAWPHVATSLAPGHQFFPADEIGLSTLWKSEPDGDGRGVRIALIDSGLDLLHPALRLAKDIQGRIIPKLAGIIAVDSPQQDAEWVETQAVHATHGSIDVAGASWRVPHDGSYRFGILDWRFYPNLPWADKRYEIHHPLHLIAGILWDTTSNVVWIDTAGKRDFTKDRALHDYAVAHQIAWFGKVDASGDNRIPFAIKIDRSRQAIYVDLALGDHGAWVAGTLAANRLSGGLFNGAAPMAQIVDVRQISSEMAPFVAAFANSNVDVINYSGGVARLFKSDEAFERVVLERLIQVYHKPLVCFCAVRGAISVADYTSPEQQRRNRRASPPYRETINGGTWSSWSPNPGGIENFLLAPSASLTTQSRYLPVDYPRADGRIGPDWDTRSFDPPAPAGYAVGENPSPTITIVTGLVADLIALARRHHIRYDAVRMSNALFTGSRIVAGFPASVQENGLVNALGAWRQLVAMNRVDDPADPELTHFDVLRYPDKSPIDGYFENILKPSGDLIRRIWIVRRGGYAGSRVYHLSMRPDGIPGSSVFTPLRTRVAFARDVPVLVAFRIHPTSGDQLAYMQLTDARSGTVMQQIPLQIIAPDALSEIAPGVMTFHTNLPPRHIESRYFVLPDRVTAVHVRINIPFGGPSFPSYLLGRRTVSNGDWISQFNVGILATGPALDPLHYVGPMDDLEVINPQPNPSAFWRVTWENRGLPEYETQYMPPAPTVPIPATVTFDEYRVDVQRNGNTFVFTNALASLNGRIEFFASPTSVQPISGSEMGYALRQHGEQWTISLPSNVLPSGELYWALRLAPLKSDSNKAGYLTPRRAVENVPARAL